jgi:hypothetical protein
MRMRRKHMADDKEVKKPIPISKETTPETGRDLDEGDLEKVAGGEGPETTALTCNDAFCHQVH